MGEIHLIIVWQNGTDKLDEIIADISKIFVIKSVFKNNWSEDHFSKNLTRFYGQNLPEGCDKATHIGIGHFHAIIFLDPTPKCGMRETTKGALEVNTNVFDAKQTYREWTGGGHRIHATNSATESLHDIWLLLARDPEEFAAVSDWNGSIETIATDLVGTGGWENIELFFSTLNRLCNYIVVRNFESLPKNYCLESHGDIDLLVDDLELCVHISDGVKAFAEDHRVHYYVRIAGEMVPFDFRYVGDSYYDINFEKNLLQNRVFVSNCFYAPCPVDYFYSLLYHALIHKSNFSDDYSERLRKLATEIEIDFDGFLYKGVRLLAKYLYENDYEYVQPNDFSVLYNIRSVSDLMGHRVSEQKIAEILNRTADLSVLSSELRQYCADWSSLYHLSSARANILRSFEPDLRGSILEIGAGCGAITRYLGECGGKVWALEGSPRRAAIARSRTRDLPNVTVVADKFDQFQCDQQFDVITLIGVLEYANLFTGGDTPALSMLQRVRSLLKPNGKLIIAIANQLGLKYFAGAPEDHLGQPMYGIEGRYRKDQPQTYGRKTLTEMLSQAGFAYSEFMAPFPDYRLPVSIVTESGFSYEGFDASALAWQSVRRDPQLPPLLAFSPELVWPTLVQNGVALDLANSFLIVAGATVAQGLDSSILAWHFSTERSKEFCKENRFLRTDNDLIEVQYHLLAPGSTQHADGRLLKFFVPEKAEYAHGRPLSQELIYIVTREGWRIEEVGAFLKRYLHILGSIDSTCEVPLQINSADTLLSGEFFDLLPQNIIVGHDGSWQVIDKEWTLNDDISAGRLVFRSFLSLIQTVTCFGDTASDFVNTPLGFIHAAFKAIGFTVTDVEIESYAKLELEVQAEVAGRPLKIDEFLNWLRNDSLLRQNLTHAVVEGDGQIVSINHSVAEVSVWAQSLQAGIEERDGQIGSVNAERDNAMALANLMRYSTSWRLTRPLRFVARLARYGLTNEDRQALRQRYHRLPLPAPAKRLVSFFHDKIVGKAARAIRRSALRTSQFQPPSIESPSKPNIVPDYIVWGVIDWHFRHQRPQQLSVALANTGRRVFYISPNFTDDERAGFEFEALDDGGLLFQVKLFVKGAPVIYSAAPEVETIAQLRASIGEMLEWANSKQIISLVDHPFWHDIASALPNSRLIYDCMDHHEGFGNNAASLMQLEKSMISSADLTITTSSWLDNAVGPHARRRALIRNAGDYDHFCRAPDSVYRDPQGRRIIGYYGAIAEWFDLDLVEAVAKHHPECCVLLIGADTVNARAGLAKLPNVTFTGEVPYSQLPYYLYGFDVCLLPFKVIPLTLATNPVKVYEYLGAGKPVVVVDLPEMTQFVGLVYAAADKDAFVAAVGNVLSRPEPDALVRQRKAFAQGQTWRHRAEVLIEYAESAAHDPKISVVVVTYNNQEFTRACLASLDEYSHYENIEIIVVDNASSDGSPAFLAEWVAGESNRQLILNEDNRGFAAANNQGLEIAGGDYLVMLNNDTYVTPGWIRTMVRHLVRDKTIGLIGPVTNNIGNEAKIDITYGSMDEMLLKSAAFTRRHVGLTFPLRTAAFFCVMMPRTTYSRVGTLDEVFGRGFFEDDDYCRRIEQLGLRVVCAEDVFVHHHLSASFDKLKGDEKQELMNRNKAIYEKKWGAWLPHAYRD